LMKSIFALLYMLSLAFPHVANAHTEKSGNVSGQTWPAGTYLVTGSLTVDGHTTLTVEAGAVVKFQPGSQLLVYGTLIANGTASDNVVFTSRDDNVYGETVPESDGSPDPGDWLGIILQGPYG
jgi:hypothetical protein